VRWRGEANAAAFRWWKTALEGGGIPASTLQVGERMGQVRGGLSGKNEEGCVRVGVLTRDGGATAFCEADGGGNGGISGGAADVAHRRGRGELGGAELRWPLCAAGGFEEEKWREGGGGGGSRLGNGEARRGKEKGGFGVGGATRRKEEGGWRPEGRAAGGGGCRSATCKQGRGGSCAWAVREGVGRSGKGVSWAGP
jgi:hypothetical protein